MATDDGAPPGRSPAGDDLRPEDFSDTTPPADPPRPPRRSGSWGKRLLVGAGLLAALGLGGHFAPKAYHSIQDGKARVAAAEQRRARENAQNASDARLFEGVEAAIPYIQKHPGQDFHSNILPLGVSKEDVQATDAFKAAAALDAKVEASEAKPVTPAKPTWTARAYTQAEKDYAAATYQAAQDLCAPTVAHKVRAGETLSSIARLYSSGDVHLKVADLDAHGRKPTAIRAGVDLVDVKVYNNCPPAAPLVTTPAVAVVSTDVSLDQKLADCFTEKQFTDAATYTQDGSKAYDASLTTAKQVDAEVHVQAAKYAKHGLKDAELKTLVTAVQAELDAVQGKRTELVSIQEHIKLCLNPEQYAQYEPAQHLEAQIAKYDAQVSHLELDLNNFSTVLAGDKAVRKELAESLRQEYRVDQKAEKAERKAAKQAAHEAKQQEHKAAKGGPDAESGKAKYDSLRVDRPASVLDNILFSEGKVKAEKMVSLGEIASSAGVPADQTPVYNLRANNGVHFRYAGDDLNMRLYEVSFTQTGIQLGDEVVFGAHEQKFDGKAKKANTFDSLADTGARMGFNFDRKPGVKYHGVERADSIRTATDAPNMYALVDPATQQSVAYIAPMPHQRIAVTVGKYLAAAAAGAAFNGGGAGAVASPPGPGPGNGSP